MLWKKKQYFSHSRTAVAYRFDFWSEHSRRWPRAVACPTRFCWPVYQASWHIHSAWRCLIRHCFENIDPLWLSTTKQFSLDNCSKDTGIPLHNGYSVWFHWEWIPESQSCRWWHQLSPSLAAMFVCPSRSADWGALWTHLWSDRSSLCFRFSTRLERPNEQRWIQGQNQAHCQCRRCSTATGWRCPRCRSALDWTLSRRLEMISRDKWPLAVPLTKRLCSPTHCNTKQTR